MNAVFIHIPKTAGGYIIARLGLEKLIYPHRAKRLFKQKGLVSFGHQNYLRLVRRGVVGKKFHRNSFKFAFVRNPFDRCVSHYFWTRLKHPAILSRTVSFLEFTRNLSKICVPNRMLKHDGRRNHFRSQSIPIHNIDMDFMGRYERLDDDLKKVAKIIGAKFKPGPRVRDTKHGPYHTYYCEESEDNVRQYYAEDFKRFGYDNNLLHE